jgi:hypothetical protein
LENCIFAVCCESGQLDTGVRLNVIGGKLCWMGCSWSDENASDSRNLMGFKLCG